MNHCRRCDCDFEKPGTCNCFAKVAPREDVPVPVVPWVPTPVVPVYPQLPSPWWEVAPGTYNPRPWWLYQTTCGDSLTYYTAGSDTPRIRVQADAPPRMCEAD